MRPASSVADARGSGSSGGTDNHAAASPRLTGDARDARWRWGRCDRNAIPLPAPIRAPRARIGTPGVACGHARGELRRTGRDRASPSSRRGGGTLPPSGSAGRSRPRGRRGGGPRSARRPRPSVRRAADAASRPPGLDRGRARPRPRPAAPASAPGTRRRSRASGCRRSRRAWSTSGGHATASPAWIRDFSSPTPTQPPPSITMNQAAVGVRVRGDPRRAAPNASSAMTPGGPALDDLGLIPVVPAGPSGRR